MRKGLTTPEQIEAMKAELEAAKQKKLAVKKSTFSKIIKLCSFLFVIAFLAYILVDVLIAKSRGETPDVFGYQLYVVETASMEPTLPVGCMILSKIPKDPSALKVGTVVTYKNTDGKTVTHRIIEVIKDENNKISYRTKGDNPINSPDKELLTPDRVVAILVFKVPLT